MIFYGPPGTGKTFVAQRLAAALAGDPARTMLVQFHPSTSYEDFFEGFRPLPAADGGIAYALQDGPLRIMAAAAESDSAHTYIRVIDEINRAQLQKVRRVIKSCPHPLTTRPWPSPQQSRRMFMPCQRCV